MKNKVTVKGKGRYLEADFRKKPTVRTRKFLATIWYSKQIARRHDLNETEMKAVKEQAEIKTSDEKELKHIAKSI